MIKKLKQYFVAAIATMAFALPAVAFPLTAHAADITVPSPTDTNIRDQFCSGTDISVSDSANCNTAAAEDNVNNVVKLAINLFSAIVGIISVVMIIVGGIRYITSGGDSGNVQAAKNTILYAVIGLVVVALAQVIVRFVLARFTGTS